MVVGALIFGLNAAYGIWWWNASIDVEGVDVRTAWTVTDDELGGESYEARIKLSAPREADAEIVEVADNEKVVINPNPPKDTDGRREDSGRGWVRELQGRWPGVLG